MAKSDFYSRFGIQIDANEARHRFVNRVYNKIFDKHLNERVAQRPDIEKKFPTSLADLFGERINDFFGNPLRDFGIQEALALYVRADFERMLQAVELLWELDPHYSYEDHIVTDIIEESEASLGIRWELGKFYPQGDELLDTRL